MTLQRAGGVFQLRGPGASTLWWCCAILLGLWAILGTLGAPAAAQAAENPYDGNWHFRLTPYLWLPTTTGNLRFDTPGGVSSVNIKPSTLLSKFDFGFMGAAEAQKGNLNVFTDIIYLKLSDENGAVKSVTGPGGAVEMPVDIGTKVGLKAFVWTLAPAYTVINEPAGSLDLLIGFRDAQFKPSLDWQFQGPLTSLPRTGNFSKTVVLWDALIGIKGRIRLSESGKWFAPYYFDLGTGASTLTSQGVIGVGYAFEWGDLHLDYRALYYSTQNSRVLDGVTLHGPALAATFHF